MPPVRVKRPEGILFDLAGTATKTDFINKVLFPYIRINCETYLHNNWNNKVVQADIDRLRQQVSKDGDGKIASTTGSRSEQIRTITNYVLKSLDQVKQNNAIDIFRLHMWFDGYKRGKLETPVYSDVAIQIKRWRCDFGIKLYVFSNGWTEATKRFMAKTSHGDLNLLIDDHFDNTQGPLTNPATFQKILQTIEMEPSRVLFLTKSVEEGKAAKRAGLKVVLVMTHRRTIARLSDKDLDTWQIIRTFNELSFEKDKKSSRLSNSKSGASSRARSSKSGVSRSIKASSDSNAEDAESDAAEALGSGAGSRASSNNASSAANSSQSSDDM